MVVNNDLSFNKGLIVNGDASFNGNVNVTGDITLSAGFTSAEAMDSLTIGTKGTTVDSKDITDAGISYAVASGVTANLGWKNIDTTDEGASDNTGGTSWYIGASMSF